VIKRFLSRLVKPFLRLFEGYRFVRLTLLVLALWMAGAAALWVVEGRENPEEFGTLPSAVWNIAVYLLSGLDTATPRTGLGRGIVAVVLVLGVGIVAVFTGNIASILVERRIGRRRLMPTYELKDHIIICNWNDKGLPIVQQLHASIVRLKRPIVIVAERLQEVDLPDKEDLPELEDVYLIKGDPTQEHSLRRANVHLAFSVVVLADPEQKHLADAKNVLICMAIKSLCKQEGESMNAILVEGVDPKNTEHLQRAGASEIVSAQDFSLKLLAQSALNPGLSTVYGRLLTISGETNEIYMEPVPPAFFGKSFTETARILDPTRSSENPLLPLGVVRDGEITINPRNGVFDAFREGDSLVMVAWEQPELADRFKT
jgi:voltage-gated potassium channel